MIEALQLLTLGIGGIAAILTVILLVFTALPRRLRGQRDRKKRE